MRIDFQKIIQIKINLYEKKQKQRYNYEKRKWGQNFNLKLCIRKLNLLFLKIITFLQYSLKESLTKFIIQY